jgi:hypothetical protein
MFRGAITLLAVVPILALCACESEPEQPAPPVQPHAIEAGGLSFPPLDKPLAQASPELRALVRGFERFLVEAELPALQKDDYLEISEEEILARKKAWIDRQLVGRLEALRERVAGLEQLAERVPEAQPVERIAALALVGCARQVLRGDWESLDGGSAAWMLGPRASVPSHFSELQVAALEAREVSVQAQVQAYLAERLQSLGQPDARAGMFLGRCLEATRGKVDPTLRAWHDFCNDWRR